MSICRFVSSIYLSHPFVSSLVCPFVFVVLSLSLSLCAHHIFSWDLLCTSTTPRFVPLVLYVLSLFGLPLLFFVCSLFLVCPSCSLCVLSLSICEHTISSHGLFSALRPLRGLPLLFFVSSLFLVCPSCSLCALSFWFAPLVLWVLSLFGFPLLFFMCSLFLVCPSCLCALSLCAFAISALDHSEIFLGLHIVVCGLLLEPDVTSASSEISWDCT